MIETAASTFLLLIAVKYFHAGATAKGLVASGGSLGLILSPAVVTLVSRWGWSSSVAASRMAAVGGAVMLLMAAIPVLPVYVIGSILAMTTTSAAIPLLTQMYHENYPEKTRGQLFSRTIILRIGTAALFSEFAGRAFSGRIDRFQILLVTFALAFFLASYCLRKCPTESLPRRIGTHPFGALHFVREDALLRRTLLCWMLMGFANLMMIPMRVEMLANPRYGLSLSVAEIAFLTGVVPNLARLVLSPIWGWLFDHLNFFILRVVLNMGFAIGIVTFFTTSDLYGLLLGAVVFGISNAGGDIAWSLWVTKFAPPGRVADYMSVHTFFTGLRGVAAPLAAFHLARNYSMEALGWFSAGLIVLASLLLVPEIKFRPKTPEAEPAVEEVSE